nr:MAG TPA: hypothetical protein [Caudoviricetes sp.]
MPECAILAGYLYRSVHRDKDGRTTCDEIPLPCCALFGFAGLRVS